MAIVCVCAYVGCNNRRVCNVCARRADDEGKRFAIAKHTLRHHHHHLRRENAFPAPPYHRISHMTVCYYSYTHLSRSLSALV